MDIAGKKALVFGGTSGIGLATALRLQKLGADVTVISRDPSKHKSVPAGLKVVACNVLDREALQQLFEKEAPFDILVSAATGGALVRVTHAGSECLETAGTSVAVGLSVDVYKCHGLSPGAPVDANQLWAWAAGAADGGAPAPLVNELSGLCAAFCVHQ